MALYFEPSKVSKLEPKLADTHTEFEWNRFSNMLTGINYLIELSFGSFK